MSEQAARKTDVHEPAQSAGAAPIATDLETDLFGDIQWFPQPRNFERCFFPVSKIASEDDGAVKWFRLRLQDVRCKGKKLCFLLLRAPVLPRLTVPHLMRLLPSCCHLGQTCVPEPQ